MLVRLNLATRDSHEAADETWQRLATGPFTRGDYLYQLSLVYGFEAPLEAALAYTPNLRLLIDLRKRSRAGLLAQDLLTLGMRAAQLSALPQCTAIASFASPLEALGWMYVAERATLMHDAVRRHVERVLPTAPTAYLSSYAGVAGARWAEFGHVLDQAAPTDAMGYDMVRAAIAAFRCWHAWTRETPTLQAAGS